MSLGSNYTSRLDNEDVIIMLMRKLPDEGLNRKWADRAGDLIKDKGRAEFADFVSFIKRVAERINNRYGQELKPFSSTERERKESGRGKADYPPRVTSLATLSDETQQSLDMPTSVPLKCPRRSGPHGVWRCRIFRSSSLRDRLKTVKQHLLCRVCLSEGHSVMKCAKGFTCRKVGCGKDHHYLIHSDEGNGDRNGTCPSCSNVSSSAEGSGAAERSATERRSPLVPTTVKVNPVTPPMLDDSTAATSGNPVTVGAVRANRPRVCFKVVPVKITGNCGTKEIIMHF